MIHSKTVPSMLGPGGIVAAGVLAGALGGAAAASDPAPRPHMVLIVADDLGYGDIEPFGQQMIRTPHLQRLADEGVRFTQFYAGSTVCSPSREVLMTGMHAGRIVADRNWQPNYPMRREAICVAEVLQAAGYETAFFGKWGLGGAFPSPDMGGNGEFIPWHAYGTPSAKGFDEALAFLDQASGHIYWPLHLWRNDEKWIIPENQGVIPTPIATIPWPPEDRERYVEDILTDEAVAILEAADGSAPLHIQMSYIIPHRETRFPAGIDYYEDEPWPAIERAFASMVTHLDMNVGRLLDAIESNPALAGNTMVLFTSDNGPQSTDGHSPEFFNSSGPLRGIKRDLTEGGIRVPTIAWWPGTIPPGAVSDHMGHFADWLPTAAELAGEPIPQGLDGVSFAPILLGGTTADEQEFLYWEFWEGGPGAHRYAVRRGDWKYLALADGREFLYDLATDLGETTDLSAQHPQVLAELRAIAAANGDGPPPVGIPRIAAVGDAEPASAPAPPPTRPATTADTIAYWRFDNDGFNPGVQPFPSSQSAPHRIPIAEETGAHPGEAVGRVPLRSCAPIHSADIPHRHVPGTGADNAVSIILDGSATQHLEAPHALAFDFGGAQAMTIEAFVRLDKLAEAPLSGDDRAWLVQKKDWTAPDSAADYALLVQMGDLSSNPGVVRFGNTDGATGREIGWLFGSGSQVWAVVSHFEIDDDQWRFVAASVDPAAGRARFVLDDQVEEIEFDAPGWAGPNTGPMVMGAHTNAAGQFNQFLHGAIDEVRLTRGVVAPGDLLRPVGFQEEPAVFVLDFGTIAPGSDPVARRFRVANTAEGYSMLLDGTVGFAPGTDDPRVSLSTTAFRGLANGGPSREEFEVVVDPSSAGSLDGVEILVHASPRVYATPVPGGPVVVRLSGEVGTAASVPDWADQADAGIAGR